MYNTFTDTKEDTTANEQKILLLSPSTYHTINKYNSTGTTSSCAIESKSKRTTRSRNPSSNSSNSSSGAQHSRAYWQSLLDHYSTSVYLENKGSVARDHLANERTYLAWLRTSLSTISVGIGITQLFRLQRQPSHSHHPSSSSGSGHDLISITADNTFFQGQMIGVLFIFISMLFLIFAFVRYFHTQAAMIKGFFPASRLTVTIASCTLLFTMALMLALVLRRQ